MTTVTTEFINELKEGQPQAYERLLHLFKKQVMATAWQFTRNTADAEDVFQETFMEIVRSVSAFRGESALGTWIYRIAVQKALEHQRKNQRSVFVRWFSGKDNEADIPEQGHEETPLKTLEDREKADKLHQLLSDLPEKQQVAIRLFYLNQLSTSETAEIMELSESAVESLLFRARQRLKTKWQWEDGL